MISNQGYIMFAKQSAKGSTATPSIAVPYLEDTFNTVLDILDFIDDINDNVDLMKNTHNEEWGFSCYARPNITAYLLAYILGADSVAGGSDPYTHTITKLDNGRGWLTFQRKLKNSVVQQLTDAKIETISITGETGKPVSLTVNGKALSASLITTEQTPSYETSNPFLFYNGSGRFKFATTTIDNIKMFTVNINVNSSEGLKTDELLLGDLPDFGVTIDLTADYVADDENKFNKINYYDTGSANDNVYSSAFEFDMQYTESGKTRQFKIELPKVFWKSISGITLTGMPKTINESIAGIAAKQTTTEIISVTCQNNISTDLI